MSCKNVLPILDWGNVPYPEALERQQRLVELVASGAHPSCLVVTTHPPVVTVGRRTQEGDLTTWSGAVIQVTRGGRATYHGPSQIVIYPILRFVSFSPALDLLQVLDGLQSSVVTALQELGIEATQPKPSPEGDRTGVWIGDQKIASVGIAVRKWVSFHGLAFNFSHDPEAFRGLLPCGFSPQTMTDLESEQNQRGQALPDRRDFQQRILRELQARWKPLDLPVPTVSHSDV